MYNRINHMDWVSFVQHVHVARERGDTQREIAEATGYGRTYVRYAAKILGFDWSVPGSKSTLPREIPERPASVGRASLAGRRFTTQPCGCGSGYCGPSPEIDGHMEFDDDLNCLRCGVALRDYRAHGMSCDEWLRGVTYTHGE